MFFRTASVPLAHAQERAGRRAVQKSDGDWHWPDRQWLPLAMSLQARRRG